MAQNPELAAIVGLKTLEDALALIPSDVPRGMGTINGPDDDYWFGVILAIRRELGPAGEYVAREWSQRSSRYTEDGFDKAWNAFNPEHPDPVTIRSVFKLAKDCGWSGSVPSSPALPVPRASRFSHLSRDDIMALQPIQWRVKGLFPTSGTGAIFGPSSSGKSFLATDLAVRITAGQRWFGFRTSACPVTYLMLEGEAGLRNRIEAWEKHNGSPIPSDIRVVIQPFAVGDPQDVEDLAASLPKGGVVFIDTLNRATPGLDENSGKDMGQVLAGMKRLQEVTGGLVLVVHHTGKDSSRGMRGHSSLHAALDGAISVESAANRRSWSAAKVKDGLDGGPQPFKLHVLVLGKDSDGDDITSCAVGPDTAAVLAPKEPSGKQQKAALSTIRLELSLSSETGMAGCGPQTQCLKVDDAINAVAKSLTTELQNKRRNRARTIVRGLISGGFLRSELDANEEGWLWR